MADQENSVPSPEIQRKALDTVINFMSKSRDFRRRYEELWMKFLGEYMNTRNVKANALQRANLKLPYAFTTVETFVPQIVDTFLSEKPYITAECRATSKDLNRIQYFSDQAEAISAFFSYQLDQMKFFKEFIPHTKNMLIYGTAIAKIGWKTKYEPVVRRVKTADENGIPVMQKVTTEEITFDGPSFENIDILDFFTDWGASKPGDIQSMRGCVHRVYRTYEELKSLEKKGDSGIYINLDQLRYGTIKDGYDAWANMRSTLDSWSQTQREFLMNQEPGLKNQDKIEVWEYWGIFEIKPGKLAQYVLTVANGNVLIRCDVNPFDYKFKPFIATVDYVVPGEFYGVGEIEIVLSMIKEATALRNARLDQANQAVNRMWIVDRNSQINLRNLYSRSGGIILTADMNGIRELAAPEVPGSSYREIAQIDFDIQNATSQINASQAATGNAARAFGNTAKGVSFLQSYTSSRLSLKVRQMECWLMQEYGKFLLLLNRQFTADDQWVRLFNDQENPFITLDAASFEREYDFFTTGAMERLNRQQRQQNLQQNIIPFIQGVEQAQPHTIKMENLVKRYFKEFEYQNVNELINSPEERQKLVEEDQQNAIRQDMARMSMQNEQQASIAASEQAAKAERDAANSQNKAKIAAVKGIFDVATAYAGKSQPAE